MNDLSMVHRKRFVLQHGRLMQNDDKDWVFIPDPGKETVVNYYKSRSMWDVVETVYDLIQEYGKQ